MLFLNMCERELVCAYLTKIPPPGPSASNFRPRHLRRTHVQRISASSEKTPTLAGDGSGGLLSKKIGDCAVLTGRRQRKVFLYDTISFCFSIDSYNLEDSREERTPGQGR